uniref:Uncharacterized protein n=1 Tax=Setaria italica TaxID=4555 RepID=K3XSE0_SETIT
MFFFSGSTQLDFVLIFMRVQHAKGRKQRIEVDILFPVKWLGCFRIPKESNGGFLRSKRSE